MKEIPLADIVAHLSSKNEVGFMLLVITGTSCINLILI